MKAVTAKMIDSRAWKVSVVWKYVSYGLLLSCIPLIVLSFYFIHAEKESIVATERVRYEKIAETAANAFFEDVQAMQSAAASLAIEERMQDRYLGASVANDIQALKILKNYQKMLPLTTACGYYTSSNPNEVYYTDGKWRKDIFEKYVFTEEGFLDRVLNDTRSISFSGWCEKDSICVCAIPVRSYDDGSPKQVLFFVINSFSLMDRFSMVLLGVPESSIAGIWDADGELLFLNNSCEISESTLKNIADNRLYTIPENDNYYFSGRSNGYQLLLYVPQGYLYETTEAYSSSLTLIIAIDILLCFMLVGVFAYLNYKPVKSLMNSIGLEPGRSSEFSLIRESYNQKNSRVIELQQENAENRRLLVSHVLEKLLNGVSLRSRDMLVLEKAFGGQKGCFFVAVAALSEESAPPVFEYEDEKGIILPIEMLNDGFLAYVCKTDSVNRYGQLLDLIAERCMPHIGAGSIGVDCQNLHKSYLEAILALTRSGNAPVSMIDSVFSSMEDGGEEDRSMSLIRVSRMLKNGDQTALSEIDQMFDRLLVTDQPGSVRKYACFQLIQKLQQSIVRMGIDFSDEQAAKILDSGNVAAMRNALFEHLNAVLNSVRIVNAETLRALSKKTMDIVEKDFTNNAFNLSMLADSAGVTEYTASHIVKEITGQNLQDYLKLKRIAAAKELLLQTEDSVNDIALGVGFSSCSYFIRVFKGEEGMTPAAYRQMRGISEKSEH